ncbi:MAG: hypothetical protein CVV64_13105 [Candidatus Wallbacteria bacterium HGW-Wallbacteria-1]|uniref:Diguanylate cyclase n=1 Tax=Candidatus Wallbacteria bacterium HGW-Wallbacteria-1 TaxID=2013854 RepID=A0A2N1PN29_9BACT|nr:MAG: hypothetical protein CVV64_13105 [Candidatus Wallbacteria bacterium HGW-Wallbacteria-1]
MKRKLIFFLVGVLVIPTLLTMRTVETLVSRGIENSIVKRIASSLDVADNLFMAQMDDASLKARIISQMTAIQESIMSGDVIELIDRVNSACGDLKINQFSGIVEVFGKSGNILASVPRTPVALVEPSRIRAALEGALFQGPIGEENNIRLTTVMPVYHKSQSSPVGVIAITYGIEDSLVDRIKAISGSEVVVFVQEPRMRTVASTILMAGQRQYPLILGKDKNVKSISCGSIDFYMASRPMQLGQSSFNLGVLIPRHELTETLSELRSSFMMLAIATLVILLAGSVIFGRKVIVEPISRLVDSATALGQGDLDSEITLATDDEFQFLALSFDTMRNRIRDYIRDLDLRIRDLTLMDKLNSAIILKSGDALLLDILSIIAKAIGSSRSSIMMIDESSGNLVLKAVHSTDQDSGATIKEYVSFEPGEGVAGHVAVSGIPLVCNDTASCDRFKPYSDSWMNEELRNLASVPLMGEGEILGVINVANKSAAGRGFTESDVATLEKAARQVAIALQKSRLYELAITDGLTQLYIHRYFQARMDNEIVRARRYSGSVCLLLFDIDHFKNFNDTWGHQVGDKVIRIVADALRSGHRESVDVPARYGGEEFALIMPEVDLEGALLVAERLRQKVEKSTLSHNGQSLHVTISLGIARFPDHASTKEELIARADEALYRSKDNGRNQTTVYS